MVVLSFSLFSSAQYSGYIDYCQSEPLKLTPLFRIIEILFLYILISLAITISSYNRLKLFICRNSQLFSAILVINLFYMSYSIIEYPIVENTIRFLTNKSTIFSAHPYRIISILHSLVLLFFNLKHFKKPVKTTIYYLVNFVAILSIVIALLFPIWAPEPLICRG